LQPYLLAIGVTALHAQSGAHASEAIDILTVYAGPQSVSSDENIHVTVEARGESGKSVHDHLVRVSYLSNGISKTVSGKTEHGLVSFQVPAQSTVGLMKFTAATSAVVSNQAFVMVSAGPPEKFSLSIKSAQQAGAVDIHSGLIVDSFGNQVSGLSLISIDWVDNTGLQRTQNVQPTDGRLILTAACPRKWAGTLKIRASLKNTSALSSDISSLCLVGES